MSYKFTTEDRQAIVDTATRLGVSAAALTMAMGYETVGTMNPDIRGGAHGAYRGAIQFGPSERKQYGYKPGMSLAEQVRGPVYNYLKDRGLKPGMGLAHIYSIINAGSLTKGGQPRWNARDQNGTVREHVQRITKEYMGKGSRADLTPPLNVGQTAQGRQMPLGMGRNRLDHGPEVAKLQQRLTDLGFNPGPVDGQFGKRTEAAVRAAEQKFGLSVERPGKGAAGPAVQSALELASHPAYAPGGSVPPVGFPSAWGEQPANPPAYSPGGSMPAPGGVPAAPFNVGAGTMPGAGAISPPGYAPSAADRQPPLDIVPLPYSPPSISPNPNQFGPDMAFLNRLAQPMNETLPGGVPPGTPQGTPTPWDTAAVAPVDTVYGSRGLRNRGWDSVRGKDTTLPVAGPDPKSVSDDTSYSDAGAGGRYTQDWGQNAGVPSIGSIGSILNGLGLGGTAPATAKPPIAPAVPPGGFGDRYGPGAGLSAGAYPMPPQQQSSIGGAQYAGPGASAFGWSINPQGEPQRQNRSVIEDPNIGSFDGSSYGQAGFNAEIPQDGALTAPLFDGQASSPSGFGGFEGAYPAPKPASLLNQYPDSYYDPRNVAVPYGAKPALYASGGPFTGTPYRTPSSSYAGNPYDYTGGPSSAGAAEMPDTAASYRTSGRGFSAEAPWKSPSAGPGLTPAGGVPATSYPYAATPLADSPQALYGGEPMAAAYAPPPSLDVSLAGSKPDQAKAAVAAASQPPSAPGGPGPSSSGGYSGYSARSGGGSGAGGSGFHSPNWTSYPSAIGGSVWTPSGMTPGGTPYINNTGDWTVDQNGNRVNVGQYSMNGVTHQYTY